MLVVVRELAVERTLVAAILIFSVTESLVPSMAVDQNPYLLAHTLGVGAHDST